MQNRFRSMFDPRQYMLSEDFEVYYYSDVHFKSVGSHRHDYYEFYFFLEGGVAMEIEGESYPLKSGDVVVVPPDVPHRALVNADLPYRRFVFWGSREYCGSLTAQAADYGYLIERVEASRKYIFHFDMIGFNALQGKLFTLLDELHTNRFGREPKIALAASDLLLHLNRAVYEQEHPPKQENLSLYEAITNFINVHLEEDLTLDRLSGTFFVSKYYIAHLFRERTGLSIHQYILKKRLAACCDAICGGARINETAVLLGFKDYSGFYRAFKKEYGMPPSEYAELGQKRGSKAGPE